MGSAVPIHLPQGARKGLLAAVAAELGAPLLPTRASMERCLAFWRRASEQGHAPALRKLPGLVPPRFNVVGLELGSLSKWLRGVYSVQAPYG